MSDCKVILDRYKLAWLNFFVMRLTKYHLIEALMIVDCRYDNCIKGTEIKREQFDFVFIKCYKFTLKSFSCAIKNDTSFIHSTRLGVFIY